MILNKVGAKFHEGAATYFSTNRCPSRAQTTGPP